MKKTTTETPTLPLVGVRLPGEWHRRLKAAAALEGRELQDVLAEAVAEYLARRGTKA